MVTSKLSAECSFVALQVVHVAITTAIEAKKQQQGSKEDQDMK
jgi:hypothetical protein